ncbi:MAG: hypothetical protein DMG09_25945 [Acidobacteria bacterium]|nr:MAG: hypothetical protein DMG09_25945 [Acidobacteriota bacterium]
MAAAEARWCLGLCHAEGRAGRKQGAILGTLQYLAPGQLEGKSVDARTDIFAFGALVYEMLTGKGAFQAESQAAIDWWNPQGRSAAPSHKGGLPISKLRYYDRSLAFYIDGCR